jgi:hypothetical protein
MNGELSQLVAFAAHGNAFLSGATGLPDLDGTSAPKRTRHDTTFEDVFERSLALLDTDGGETDLLPATGYGLEARRLLVSADHAWVFGRMGSWNDLGFDDKAVQSEYEARTRELFAAVLGGIVTATNSLDGAVR